MRSYAPDRVSALTVIAALVALPTLVAAEHPIKNEFPKIAKSTPLPDGQHDFDWLIGTWKVYLKRLQHPLTGSKTWIEYEGTETVRKVWDGRANLDEFIGHSAATNDHLEGLTLRLYNPESHEWSLYWANSKNGALSLPPTVGGYKNGRGEFYDREQFEGRNILVRYIWSDITPTSAKFEQAFSTDDGKTWEPNWISTITRSKE